ncbi:Hypothetical protein SRAE_1000096100 [Strongyloides ratti]|uniref:Uncharacterized protein n=1 Tax=Strongyloides ratti TaxID=34506 RepID=A0A090KZ69_STRRB|nr:Hypothetical protein SRAE_1000096100 [Strongyloides ratti]CEF62691.1 Hypothetical protein SRAE_1000096100 [Strongyloides ratti]
MNDNTYFFTILNQSHLWKTISKYFSFNDYSNFSLTCKEYLKALSCIKRNDNITNLKNYYSTLFIRTPDDIILSKLFENICFKEGYVNINDQKKVECIIMPTQIYLTKKNMSIIGKKLGRLLNTLPHIQELSIKFELSPQFNILAGCVLKEISNNSIVTLDIHNFEETFECNKVYTFLICESQIFNGFKNLRKIIIHPSEPIIHDIDKHFIDVVSKIPGITIETNFYKFDGEVSAFDRCLQKENCIFTYILKKKVFLMITGGIYFNAFKLKSWLNNLDESDLSFIASLHFKVSSIGTLHETSKFLPKMINLQRLGIQFIVNHFTIQVELKFLEKIRKSKKILYESFKHLRKLKKIEISFNFVTNFDRKIIENIFLEDMNFSNYQKSIQDEIQIFTMCTKICLEEVLCFLNEAPDCVEKLYFSNMLEFTCEMTSRLNDYFPNLEFLFLNKITKSDKKCLKNFKKLKFFVSSCMIDLELPQTIEAFMLSINNTFYMRKNEKEKYFQLCDGYRKLNQFTKECYLTDSFEGIIMYNYFHSLYAIRNHFICMLDYTFINT